MRFATWNLNHRATRKKIPAVVVDVIDALAVDAVVLTEFVPGPDRVDFYDSLRRVGFMHTSVSDALAGHTRQENHVLVASRTPLVRGTLRGPAIDPSIPSNTLHARLPELGIELFGVRVPDYSKVPPVRRACWDWLVDASATLLTAPSIMLGDLNVDPSYPKAKCGHRLAEMVAHGWTSASPTQGHSYQAVASNAPRRLDHAFASEHFRVTSSRYVATLGAHSLMGDAAALSDHAALVVDVELREPRA